MKEDEEQDKQGTLVAPTSPSRQATVDLLRQKREREETGPSRLRSGILGGSSSIDPVASLTRPMRLMGREYDEQNNQSTKRQRPQGPSALLREQMRSRVEESLSEERGKEEQEKEE